MNNENQPLPDAVIDALQNGHTIEAIKLLRSATGLGLKEAKDVIDRYQSGNPLTHTAADSINQLPASVLDALQQGNKIEAIKRLREQTGLGLKEAKDAVEAKGAGTANGYRPTIVKPRTMGAGWWLAGLALLGYAAYYFLRDAAG